MLAAGSCTNGGASASGSDLDAIPRLAMEEDARIGSMDDPDYGFTGIAGVDVDRDGNVYVFESTDMQIRVYSPEGRLIRRLGGRGEGPGEFQMWPRFGVLGDTVWAVETSSRRVSLFLRDGTVLSTAPIHSVSVPLQTNIGIVMPVAMRSDGLFTSDLAVYTYSRDMKLDVGENDTVQIPRILFDATGAVVDTVGWMPHPPRHSTMGERLEMGSNRYYVPPAPSDDPLLIALPDGMIRIERPAAASADPATLTITRFDLAGDTVYRREWRYLPRPFDDAALDTVAWRAARTPGGGIPIINGVPTPPPVPDDSMEVFREIRGRLDFPAFQSPVPREREGRDGTLWLMREEEGGPVQRWTILDTATGDMVGDMELPRTLQPVRMSADGFWAIERDEMDVPWLAHYRLRVE